MITWLVYRINAATSILHFTWYTRYTECYQPFYIHVFTLYILRKFVSCCLVKSLVVHKAHFYIFYKIFLSNNITTGCYFGTSQTRRHGYTWRGYVRILIFLYISPHHHQHCILTLFICFLSLLSISLILVWFNFRVSSSFIHSFTIVESESHNLFSGGVIQLITCRDKRKNSDRLI